MLKRLLLLSLIWGGVTLSSAYAAGLSEGIDYTRITPPVTVISTKHEVVEVFNFKCPHCFTLHPEFDAWAAPRRETMVIKAMPIVWGDQSDAPVRAYYAADFMGKGVEMKDAIFNAQFKDSLNIEDPNQLLGLAQGLGLDAEKFQKQLSSFGVSARLAQGVKLKQAYGINATPSLVVNGKFMITPESAGGDNQRMLQIVEELIAQ